jgi:hypothetical protein
LTASTLSLGSVFSAGGPSSSTYSASSLRFSGSSAFSKLGIGEPGMP